MTLTLRTDTAGQEQRRRLKPIERVAELLLKDGTGHQYGQIEEPRERSIEIPMERSGNTEV